MAYQESHWHDCNCTMHSTRAFVIRVNRSRPSMIWLTTRRWQHSASIDNDLLSKDTSAAGPRTNPLKVSWKCEFWIILGIMNGLLVSCSSTSAISKRTITSNSLRFWLHHSPPDKPFPSVWIHKHWINFTIAPLPVTWRHQELWYFHNKIRVYDNRVLCSDCT